MMEEWFCCLSKGDGEASRDAAAAKKEVKATPPPESSGPCNKKSPTSVDLIELCILVEESEAGGSLAQHKLNMAKLGAAKHRDDVELLNMSTKWIEDMQELRADILRPDSDQASCASKLAKMIGRKEQLLIKLSTRLSGVTRQLAKKERDVMKLKTALEDMGDKQRAVVASDRKHIAEIGLIAGKLQLMERALKEKDGVINDQRQQCPPSPSGEIKEIPVVSEEKSYEDVSCEGTSIHDDRMPEETYLGDVQKTLFNNNSDSVDSNWDINLNTHSSDDFLGSEEEYLEENVVLCPVQKSCGITEQPPPVKTDFPPEFSRNSPLPQLEVEESLSYNPDCEIISTSITDKGGAASIANVTDVEDLEGADTTIDREEDEPSDAKADAETSDAALIANVTEGEELEGEGALMDQEEDEPSDAETDAETSDAASIANVTEVEELMGADTTIDREEDEQSDVSAAAETSDAASIANVTDVEELEGADDPVDQEEDEPSDVSAAAETSDAASIANVIDVEELEDADASIDRKEFEPSDVNAAAETSDAASIANVTDVEELEGADTPIDQEEDEQSDVSADDDTSKEAGEVKSAKDASADEAEMTTQLEEETKIVESMIGRSKSPQQRNEVKPTEEESPEAKVTLNKGEDFDRVPVHELEKVTASNTEQTEESELMNEKVSEQQSDNDRRTTAVAQQTGDHLSSTEFSKIVELEEKLRCLQDEKERDLTEMATLHKKTTFALEQNVASLEKEKSDLLSEVREMGKTAKWNTEEADRCQSKLKMELLNANESLSAVKASEVRSNYEKHAGQLHIDYEAKICSLQCEIQRIDEANESVKRGHAKEIESCTVEYDSNLRAERTRSAKLGAELKEAERTTCSLKKDIERKDRKLIEMQNMVATKRNNVLALEQEIKKMRVAAAKLDKDLKITKATSKRDILASQMEVETLRSTLADAHRNAADVEKSKEVEISSLRTFYEEKLAHLEESKENTGYQVFDLHRAIVGTAKSVICDADGKSNDDYEQTKITRDRIALLRSQQDVSVKQVRDEMQALLDSKDKELDTMRMEDNTKSNRLEDLELTLELKEAELSDLKRAVAASNFYGNVVTYSGDSDDDDSTLLASPTRKRTSFDVSHQNDSFQTEESGPQQEVLLRTSPRHGILSWFAKQIFFFCIRVPAKVLSFCLIVCLGSLLLLWIGAFSALTMSYLAADDNGALKIGAFVHY